ncbi:MAG TPA: DUF2127 domain-containing protein [Stellaceae bacterium]|nr:DUF2127 domain-containing protein [Stellaceae bacterium]
MKQETRETLFNVMVSLKGLDGILEIVGGLGLLMVTPGFIMGVVAFLTQDELVEDPHDLVANYVLNFARHLSIGTEHFAAYYLMAHGVVKTFMVLALLKKKIWAYPFAILVFVAFIAYQLYRYTLTHSIGLIALSGFDAVVVYFIWVEYRALRRRVEMAIKNT